MPGTTNFIQFNPTQSNQLTDSAYAADALVTGGVQLNNTLPSNFLNKLWYQDSTFVAAFAQMLVNKGYSPMDTSVSALAALLANVLTNADTQPLQLIVTYSSTAQFDRSLGQSFTMFLTGPLTAPTLVNPLGGQYITFWFFQESPGGFAVTWPTNVVGGGVIDATAPAGAIFQQTFFVGHDLVARATTGLTQY